MKFLQVILSMSFLIVLPLLVDSSISPAFNHTSFTNKTRDSPIYPVLNGTFFSNITNSSISTSLNTSALYWLSLSGNVAFGFYKLPCSRSSHCPDRYVVGIWFVKSPLKTLVWTANGDVLRKPSSIHFTNDGNLVLRVMPCNNDKPLIPNMKEPVSNAMLHDNGNLVFYGPKSQIIWQSFDHPTDTILGGQNLRSGVDLNSFGKRLHFLKGENRLSVQDSNGLVTITAKRSLEFGHNGQLGVISSESVFLLSDELHGQMSKPVILVLDTTGDLYLVDSDGVRLKDLYLNENKQQEEGGILEYIYRGTLDSRGCFKLFKERIDGNSSDHESTVLVKSWTINDKTNIFIICFLTLIVFACLVLLCLLLLIICLEAVKVAPRHLHKSSVAPFPARDHV